MERTHHSNGFSFSLLGIEVTARNCVIQQLFCIDFAHQSNDVRKTFCSCGVAFLFTVKEFQLFAVPHEIVYVRFTL